MPESTGSSATGTKFQKYIVTLIFMAENIMIHLLQVHIEKYAK